MEKVNNNKRSRWFVLTPQTLMTFKDRKVYVNPTEIIHLKNIYSIKSCEEEISKEFTFVIDFSYSA
jgi:hypothetical protein